MLPRYAFLLFLAFGLACSAGQAHAQTEGLLLGLRYQEPISKVPPYYAGRADSLLRSDYHTLLIVKRDGKISLVGNTEGLLVPRGNTFWRVGTKRSVYNDWVEDFIWAVPDGRMPKYPGIQSYNGEYCEGNRMQQILYAGENHLALEQYSAGYCEGAAHPWLFNTLAVVPIDSTTHIGLYISDVLGDAGEVAFSAAAAQFRSRLRTEEQRSRYVEEPDPANWALTRKEGRWVLVGRLDGAGEVVQGTFADFELPMAPPATLVGASRLVPGWNRIRAFAPDAVDAFSSPNDDLLVLVHRTRLTAHPVTNGEIGPAAFTLRLRNGTRPVMARWAAGARADRWIDRVSRSSTPSSTARR